MNAIDELKENLLQKRKQKQQVISVEYVLRKLREHESQDASFKEPERVIQRFNRVGQTNIW